MGSFTVRDLYGFPSRVPVAVLLRGSWAVYNQGFGALGGAIKSMV